MSIDITRAVRRIAVPDYGQGYAAPETIQSQSTPSAGTVDGAVTSADPGHGHRDFAESGLTNGAQRGGPNDFGHHVQDRLHINAYRETCHVIPAAAGVTITLEPDHGSAWEITAAGDLTIEFGQFGAIDPPNPRALLLPFVAGIVVLVHRQANSTITWPAGIQWEADVVNSFSTPPTTARTDMYVFACFPGAGWLGHVISQGYA